MYCHARDSAVNFYLKNGYTGIGNYFNEDGIPHLKMRKEL
jgi:predicted GNAT family N-acyltransferase